MRIGHFQFSFVSPTPPPCFGSCEGGPLIAQAIGDPGDGDLGARTKVAEASAVSRG